MSLFKVGDRVKHKKSGKLYEIELVGSCGDVQVNSLDSATSHWGIETNFVLYNGKPKKKKDSPVPKFKKGDIVCSIFDKSQKYRVLRSTIMSANEYTYDVESISGGNRYYNQYEEGLMLAPNHKFKIGDKVVDKTKMEPGTWTVEVLNDDGSIDVRNGSSDYCSGVSESTFDIETLNGAYHASENPEHYRESSVLCEGNSNNCHISKNKAILRNIKSFTYDGHEMKIEFNEVGK